MTPETAPLEIVVSSTASDSHTWNLIYLQLLLEELGHHVLNLGACVPAQLLVTECTLLRPDLVVLSTVNGHGYEDGLRTVTALRADSRTAGLPVVIGGKLGTAGADPAAADRLRAAGCTEVFEESATAPARFLALVGSLRPARALLAGAGPRP